jgi:hypothetical protein
MNYKILFLICLVLGFSAGCASQQPLREGVDESGNPVCLSLCSEIPGTVKAFQSRHRLETEAGKINYLLDRVRSSGLQFDRNGTVFGAAEAARFLRWKIGWYEKKYREKIKTAEDFVGKVARYSEATGRPFIVIFADGSRHNAQPVLRNELRYLNETLEKAGE